MRLLRRVAERAGAEKVMLTCFVANTGGMAFYTRLGFVTDEISPGERRLRSGKMVKPDYVILSCPAKEAE